MCEISEAFTRTAVSRGMKKTKTRMLIAELIAKFGMPFSPKEVYERLPENSSISFSTVYRNLQAFAKFGLIHQTGLAGRYVRCAHSDKDIKKGTSHILLRCISCDSVEELLEEDSLVENWLEISHLASYCSIVTEVAGHCKRCSN